MITLDTMPHVLQLLSAFVPSLQSLAAEPADMEKASKVPTVSVAKALSTDCDTFTSCSAVFTGRLVGPEAEVVVVVVGRASLRA